MTPAISSQISSAIITAQSLLQSARIPLEPELSILEQALEARNKELSAASQSMDRVRTMCENVQRTLGSTLTSPAQVTQVAKDLCTLAEKERSIAVLKFRECGLLWRQAQQRLNEARAPIHKHIDLLCQLLEIQRELEGDTF